MRVESHLESEDDSAVTRVAALLGASSSDVAACTSMPAASRYARWTVPKGDGRVRTIEAPCEVLRELQRKILRQLLDRARVSPFAHGFVRERSIVTNASAHLANARALVSVDLEDAYPSVSAERVRRSLARGCGPHLKWALPQTSKEGRSAVLDLLTDLVTHRDALPQGAPTSGALLNLVCLRLDRLARRLVLDARGAQPNLVYTRYADDLTFTSAEPFDADFVDRVIDVVRRSGFRVNRRKTRRTTERHGDLVICGVRLHEGRLELPRRTLRSYRALFHRVLREDAGAVPAELRDLVQGTLGHLTAVTSSCPAIVEGPLRALLAKHGDWLRPRRRDIERLSLPPYGS